MQKAVRHLVFTYLAFILLLAVTGFFGGALGAVLYLLAFILPSALAYVLSRSYKDEICYPKLKIASKDLFLVLPCVAPVLLITLGISALVSFVFASFGIDNGNTVDVSGNLVLVILRHALLTSVLEEILFRYIPIALLSSHSKKITVIMSSLFFAFAHCNLFQIPYAIFAGVAFCTLNLLFDSMLPSILLHFLNNVMSILWIRYANTSGFILVFLLSLTLLSLISVLALVLLRKEYARKAMPLMSDKTKLHISSEVWVFIIMTVLISLISL